jgi:hypothetical protein
MIYLIDPQSTGIGKCPTLCYLKGGCGIKPCYGVEPPVEA